MAKNRLRHVIVAAMMMFIMLLLASCTETVSNVKEPDTKNSLPFETESTAPITEADDRIDMNKWEEANPYPQSTQLNITISELYELFDRKTVDIVQYSTVNTMSKLNGYIKSM